MAYSDRQWYRGGPDPGAGNPLERTFAVGRLFRITIELHVVFLIFIAVELFAESARMKDFWWALEWVLVLCGSIFIHEMCHCFGCRWVGGRADRIIMLPFGGVALTEPPPRPWPNFITTAAGPASNLVLAVATGAAILALNESASLEFDWHPLNLVSISGAPFFSFIDRVLLFTFVINMVLFELNVLVPMMPLDGGRMLQALLWRRNGYGPSMRTAAVVGLFSAAALGIYGLMVQQFLLIGLAFLGYMHCIQVHQRFAGETGGGWSDEQPDSGPEIVGRIGPRDEERPKPREAAKPWFWQKSKADQEAEEDAAVDAILDKIHKQGIGSLTEAEKRVLKSATERQKRK